jgi:hypothetical protein
MPSRATDIAVGRRVVEQEWARVVRAERRRWRGGVRRGRIWFDEEIRRKHRRHRQTVPAFVREGSLANLLSTPVIYSLAVPFLLLDLWVSLYQVICFPIYGIPKVRRRPYFAMDRHKLVYLNTIEKANCFYCSYATGVVGFVRAVVARTEHYWCPIKHGGAVLAPHSHYRHFFDYGDAEGYRRDLPRLRKALQTPRMLMRPRHRH